VGVGPPLEARVSSQVVRAGKLAVTMSVLEVP